MTLRYDERSHDYCLAVGRVPKHLIVVIPGIGGSELADRSRSEGDRAVWWGGLGSIAEAIRDPSRLEVDRPLVPTGLLHRFAVVPFFKSIDGYDRLWATVLGCFAGATADTGNPDRPNLNAEIVAFPYDFRLGVSHAAERLAANLHSRLDQLGGETSVLFVAHSMGGLVARHWVAHHDGARRCRGIIALGTPFRGAPKALDVIANGLSWGHRMIQRPKLSSVVQNWPGLHDLAPIDDRVFDCAGTRRRAWELRDLPRHADLLRARDTHTATHEKWQDLSPEQRPVLKPVRGGGHATPAQAKWDGSRLKVCKLPLDGERSGDGTVPGFSAIPPEWSGPSATVGTIPTGDTHGQISHSRDLAALLLLLDSGDPPPIRGETAEVLEVGFDLNDLVEPGDVIDGVVLRDGSPLNGQGEGGTTLRAAMQFDNGDRVELSTEFDTSGSFRIELPHDREGVVEVKARVTLAVGVGRQTIEHVVVLGAQE